MAAAQAAPVKAEAAPTLPTYNNLQEAMAALSHQMYGKPPAPVSNEAPPAAAGKTPEGNVPEPASGTLGKPPVEEPTEEQTSEVEEEKPEGEEEKPEGEPEQDDGETIVQLEDGREVKLTELVASFAQLAELQKKTAEIEESRKAVAEEKKAFKTQAEKQKADIGLRITVLEGEVNKARNERETYARQVEQIAKMLDAQESRFNIDWQALKIADKEAYRDLRDEYNLHREAKAAAAEERAELERKAKVEAELAEQKAKEEYANNWHKRVQELDLYVTDKHPELVDSDKGRQWWKDMPETAKAAGFSHDILLATLGQRHDPRIPIMDPPIFELLYKATLYDHLVKQRDAALTPEGKPKPTTNGKIKVVKAGASRFRPPAAEVAAVGRAQAAFNANPNRENATRLMEAQMVAAAARKQ